MLSSPADKPLDRHALVSRHNIDWLDLEGQIPLGNGNFAFNADGTGLQTFGGNTMSHWAWHRFPLPPGVSAEEIPPSAVSGRGRLNPLLKDGGIEPIPWLKDWITFNPHPLNLGRLGFIDAEGKRLSPANGNCISTGHHLDLWTGFLTTHFSYQGVAVKVETCVHPARDFVAVRLTSRLLRTGGLRLRLDFPAPSSPGGTDPRCELDYQPWQTGNPVPWMGDFFNPEGHQTEICAIYADRIDVRRTIDDTLYHAVLAGSDVGRSLSLGGVSNHRIDFDPANGDEFEFICGYSSPAFTDPLPAFAETRAACAEKWSAFWQNGGAIDLSESRDSRWMELERRIVLSQYQTAVNSAGDEIPAEVGLTGCDYWSAKFHLEMAWWHLAHYDLWNRWFLAEKALGYYRRTAPTARAIAAQFDYRGLMWPKCTGPNGIHDGGGVHFALLWRQPHPIFFAEQAYRQNPTRETLDYWQEVVFGTADFMADYPTLDPKTGVYSLDPCWPACEKPAGKDFAFELGYWRWALVTAQQWRERLELGRDEQWAHLIAQLAPLPVREGLYVYSAEREDLYTLRKADHIDPIGLFAFLPPVPGFDPETAHRTLLEFARDWDWEEVWGWDFPWMAMAAARMGEPGVAVEALLTPSRRNRYDERGLCLGPGFPYLPGNGGLLYAVAMMAAGWDGAPTRHAPGFPDDGSWKVRWENLSPAI